MKKNNFLLATALMFCTLIGFSFTANSIVGEGDYTVNTAESKVKWQGYKVTGEHAGLINLKNGQLTFDSDNKLSGGSFEIDMTSIKTTDLEGEWADKLDGHLKSADFFGVEKHPTAKLDIRKVAAKGTPGDYKITGQLTIKETTKEIKFYAKVTEENGVVSATADIKIDRTDFDIRYGSGSFFDNLGDKTIYDEFDLSISIIANK